MSEVYTTRGLIERDLLEVRDVVTWTDNSRDIATEWYLNGELVRRDGWGNFLRPAVVNIGGASNGPPGGKLNGSDSHG